MSDFHFLVPSGKIAAVTIAAWLGTLGVLGDATSLLGLASVVIAAAVIVVGGIVTLRNNLKTFWKDLAIEREEKIHVLEEHAEQKLQERATFAEEQREIRHQLKTELARANAALEVERAKTDYTALFSRFDTLEQTLAAREEIFFAMKTGVDDQTVVLQAILAQLQNGSASAD